MADQHYYARHLCLRNDLDDILGAATLAAAVYRVFDNTNSTTTPQFLRSFPGDR